MPELRKDPIVSRWVIISAGRSRRPKNISRLRQRASEEPCLFCVNDGSLPQSEIFSLRDTSSASGAHWQVRVVTDKDSSVDIQGAPERRGKGIFDTIKGVGAQEIIIESPEHHTNMAHLSEEQIAKVLLCIVERVKKLEGDPRFKYVLIYKDYDPFSKKHCSSRLIAMPVAPKRIKEKLIGARNYYELHERCVFCDIIKQELKEKERLIAENEQFIAMVPFASRFPFEVLMLPKQHTHDVGSFSGQTAFLAASLIKRMLLTIERGLGDPAYSMIFYFSPFAEKKAGHWKTLKDDYHVHIEIIPRLTSIAGFEWGAGFFICPIAPEEAASYLRGVQ